MIRWLIVVFLALVLINGLSPWLQRMGLGRLPGDFRFRLFGREFFLPIASTVQQKWYNRGSFLNAALDKASLENERCALHLKTKDGRDITCVQIAGLVARRILNYVDAGVTLAPGQRYGFIRFGSRVDLYLPLDTKVKVVIGEKVQATSTVLAELS